MIQTAPVGLDRVASGIRFAPGDPDATARACLPPIALVSLIDAERQWFKARVRFAPAETPRRLSFCAHAILDPNLLVVPDALADPRFADNPLAPADSPVRFSAGRPLMSPQGLAPGPP